ncbi:MAG: biotin--[acetyl-CoA-carboxylase] ligase [Candidatus Eremiobacteraeota bacterium]|nr:biotin--[acetyl-CoA-carboxylase] ligase [Candidatus Eremiobacteraeota bacterium]
MRFSTEVASTNDEAARLLGNSSDRGCTLVADYQTAGIGRKGRAWIAPAGASLLFTTILPQELAVSALWIVPFWTALAVQAALREHNVEVQLQWPNDLLIDGAKLAGILCISRISGERAWVGCGIGINVQRVADPALDELLPSPAFVSDVSDVPREALLISILQAFATMLPWLDNPQNIARRWESAAGLPGVAYRLLIDGETEPIEARAQRLETGGALSVQTQTGTRRITLADARVLRG